MEFVVALDSAHAGDAAVVGQVGAQVAQQLSIRGFVVPARVYQTAPHGEITPDVEAAIEQAYAALGASSVSVSASPVLQHSVDLDDLPFARFTGVQGVTSIVRCIEQCWQSSTAEPARAWYAANNLNADDVALAVLVLAEASL